MLFTRSRDKETSPEQDLNLDLTELEDEIAVVFEEETRGVPPLDPFESTILGLAEAPGASVDGPSQHPFASSETTEQPLLKRQSSLTQKSLAALSAFEEEMRGTGGSLEAISEAVSTIAAAQHAATRFIGGIRAIILHSNDLEEANAALVADNRRRSQQVEQAKAQQAQQESLNEAHKRRIEQLAREGDETRMALGTAQLEANEAREALAEAETERALLIHEVAAKTAAGDRLLRDNEALRQKNMRQQVDLAEMEQRCLEAERKLEEAAALHKNEAAELSELRLKLETSEKECRRVQKQAELAQTRLEEAQERLMALEADLEELTSRHASTVNRFRSEAEALRARLDTAARKNITDEAENARLKQQLSEAVAATKVLELQLSSANGRLGGEQPVYNGDEQVPDEANATAVAVMEGETEAGKRAEKNARD